LEEGSVDHYSAINRFLNHLVFVYIKGAPTAVAMVRASQGIKLSATLDKVSLDLVYIAMILKRKSLKGVDVLRSMEFGNFEFDISFAQPFAIKV
jgi:hypothetical protein